MTLVTSRSLYVKSSQALILFVSNSTDSIQNDFNIFLVAFDFLYYDVAVNVNFKNKFEPVDTTDKLIKLISRTAF